MKTKHTQGEWRLRESVNSYDILTDTPFPIATIENKYRASKINEANARLIAAAPEGLRVAISTYISLLQMPVEAWRIENQKVFIDLRGYISKATGKSSREVQEFYEQAALLIKHDGLSFDQAIQKAEGEI